MSAPTVLVQALQAHHQRPSSRSAEHLADYSFRFDSASAPQQPALPLSGADWTLAQTLAELRRRRTAIEITSRGLRVRHAHRVSALADAVGRHETSVRIWLELGPAVTPALGWDDETDLWVRWLDTLPSPTEATELRPGISVTDWPRFRASVAGRFAEGPEAPCAAGLRRDLRDLVHRQPHAPVRSFRSSLHSKAA